MSDSGAATSARRPWPGETLELGGRLLHVRRTPAPPGGEPALFLHGLGGSATNWTDLMALLADRLEGMAVDLPGFGWSPPPADGRYSIRAHAAAVVDAIEAWGRGPVHLFGNSLGGAVATRVAAGRPDLVRSLVLVSPALPVHRAQRSNAHLPMVATPILGERLIRRFSRVAVERRVRGSFSLIYGDPTGVPPERVAEAVAEARRRSELTHESEALIGSLRSLLAGYLERGPEAPWRLAARVPAPTLLVYGLRDRLVDPATASRAARTFPNASLTLLPGSGHVAQMEHPELVARVVRRHLDTAASMPPAPLFQPTPHRASAGLRRPRSYLAVLAALISLAVAAPLLRRATRARTSEI
jgi:pimeloyl-ACP methyl ester carboxylesterase